MAIADNRPGPSGNTPANSHAITTKSSKMQKVLKVVLRLEEHTASKQNGMTRRMTVLTVAPNLPIDGEDPDAISPMQSVYRIVMEPQPVHTRGNTEDLANDGVAVTDYFFGQQSASNQTKMQGEERKKPQ